MNLDEKKLGNQYERIETTGMQQTNAGYRYDKYIGEASEFSVPEELLGFPVRIIGNKSFLSVKCIEQLTLPDTITTIEDWAFAHMKNLSRLILPANNISFGRKVFLGCDSLKEIRLSNYSNLPEGLSFLLASALRHFPRYCFAQLETLKQEQGQRDWLEQYDISLLTFIDLADEIGFEPAFIGWFDVEDVDDQKLKYIKEQKLTKLLLLFQRLHYDLYLEDTTREMLYKHLASRADFLADSLIAEEITFEDPVHYFRIWESGESLSEEIIRKLIDQMQITDPELKSFLLGKSLLPTEQENTFFDAFDL